MKKTLTIILTLFVLVAVGCASDKSKSNDLIWVENIEDAVVKAKAQDKNILVNFTGSDWCSWCIKLDKEVFSKSQFVNYAKESLILVKLDFPRTIEQSPEKISYNRAQAQKYGVRGFPTIYLLNKDGQPVQKTGYRAGGDSLYVEHLKDAFAKN